jgi:hypothetical protein
VRVDPIHAGLIRARSRRAAVQRAGADRGGVQRPGTTGRSRSCTSSPPASATTTATQSGRSRSWPERLRARAGGCRSRHAAGARLLLRHRHPGAPGPLVGRAGRGDAAWAAGPGGKGTGSAVVAAYLLAGELAAADGDLRAAFGRYERLLRPYVGKGQKQARGGMDFLAPPLRRRSPGSSGSTRSCPTCRSSG